MRSPTIFVLSRTTETVVWSTAIAVVAFWSARMGPGPSASLSRAALQALLWTCLYVGLTLSYGACLGERAQRTPGVLQRLATCLLLGVLGSRATGLALQYLV